VVLQLSAAILVGVAVAVFLAQPIPSPVDLDALVALAGLLATVLSIGLPVALIVAQHTAERHARALYAEFRREHAWYILLGCLGLGVLAIAAGGLVRPTTSTAWAALAVLAALGLLAAAYLPQMLDSLDRTKLAARITGRYVDDLERAARGRPRHLVDPAIRPIALRAVPIEAGLATEGIASGDGEVLRAGVGGLRQILLTYIRLSPVRDWGGDVLYPGFDRFDIILRQCLGEPANALLLPVVIDELTAFGAQIPPLLSGPGDNEWATHRVNGLLRDAVAYTMKADRSTAPARGTAGLGEVALAQIGAGRHSGLIDPIEKLGAISVAAREMERDHIAGEAHRQLLRVGTALGAGGADDLMAASAYEDACDALSGSVRAYAESTDRTSMLLDQAVLPIIGPLSESSAATLVVAGVRAANSAEHRRQFVSGARAAYRALLALAGSKRTLPPRVWTIDTLYSAALGTMAVAGDDIRSQVVGPWWLDCYRAVTSPVLDDPIDIDDIVASLALFATYDAVSERAGANETRKAILAALEDIPRVQDELERWRICRAWISAGRAAAGVSDDSLATAIAGAIRPSIKNELPERLRLADVPSWRLSPLSPRSLYAVLNGIPLPPLPGTHALPEAAEAFDRVVGPGRASGPGSAGRRQRARTASSAARHAPASTPQRRRVRRA